MSSDKSNKVIKSSFIENCELEYRRSVKTNNSFLWAVFSSYNSEPRTKKYDFSDPKLRFRLQKNVDSGLDKKQSRSYHEKGNVMSTSFKTSELLRPLRMWTQSKDFFDWKLNTTPEVWSFDWDLDERNKACSYERKSISGWDVVISLNWNIRSIILNTRWKSMFFFHQNEPWQV